MTPLWLPDNETQDSSVFRVFDGTTALLFATGFERYRTNTDAKEFRSPQLACLHRIIFDPSNSNVGALEPTAPCEFYEVRQTNLVIYDEVVQSSGCMMSLGGCDTFGILAIPGVFYFHLNDATAIGKAQIWLRAYPNEKLPLPLLQRYTL